MRCTGRLGGNPSTGCITADARVRMDIASHRVHGARTVRFAKIIWTQIIALLENEKLIQSEINRRRETACKTDPCERRKEILRNEQSRLRNKMERLITRFPSVPSEFLFLGTSNHHKSDRPSEGGEFRGRIKPSRGNAGRFFRVYRRRRHPAHNPGSRCSAGHGVLCCKELSTIRLRRWQASVCLGCVPAACRQCRNPPCGLGRGRLWRTPRVKPLCAQNQSDL